MSDHLKFRHRFNSEKPGSITDFFDISREVVGEGAFGACYTAVNKETKAVRAIKSIPYTKVPDLDRLEHEVAIQQKLDHPHIVKLYDVFKDAERLYLVMELCTGGELFDRIHEQETTKGGGFSEASAATYVRQIMSAVAYLHSKEYVHRDIKPENFLFQSDAPDAYLKAIDFGLARQFVPGSRKLMSTRSGTAYYIAPQVLAGAYDEKCDIWSVGCLAYILLAGRPPFPGNSEAEIYQKVKDSYKGIDFPSALWDNVSPEAKTIVSAMLSYEPEERPSAAALLKHPWLLENAIRPAATVNADVMSNMKAFVSFSKMKKVALHAIAAHVHDAQIEELRATFQTIDSNQDGKLTVMEMQRGLKKAKIPIPDNMLGIFSALDTDGSYEIDYTEFIAATLSRMQYQKEDTLWEAFRVFDIDGDGKITKEEMRKSLSQVPDAALQKMIREADKDGDGDISFDEFKSMMRVE